MESKNPLEVGKSVFIRAVTYHYTGRIEEILPDGIILADAAWVADSGRFAAALRTGKLCEVEPYPDAVYISRAAIVDVSEWAHALPRETK